MWISVLNLNLETPDLKPPKNWFSVFLFLSNCWFYYLVLYKPQQRNLEFWTYFSVISFLCLAAKEGFQTQIFKPNFSNPAFKNSCFLILKTPQKIHFKPEKGHFWFTLKGPMFLDSNRLQNLEGQKWWCPCYHAWHLQQIHMNKVFCRIYGLGVNIARPKVHVSIQIVVYWCNRNDT